jgi:hypothetical protein
LVTLQLQQVYRGDTWSGPHKRCRRHGRSLILAVFFVFLRACQRSLGRLGSIHFSLNNSPFPLKPKLKLYFIHDCRLVSLFVKWTHYSDRDTIK